MFNSLLLSPWTRLLVSLALELTIVFVVAALVARLARPASRQGVVWRLGFVVAAVLLIVEFIGLGHATVQTLRPVPRVATQARFTKVIVSVNPAPFAVAASPSPGINPPANPPLMAQPAPAPAWPEWWPALLPLAGLLWLSWRRVIAAISFARLGRSHLTEADGVEDRAQALARRLAIRRRVRVRVIARLSGPIAFGVFRPVIGVPAGFATGHTPAQQDAMLAHELAHVAAFDALWILAADLVTALVWWHPLAWWARRRLRAACEAAADEASLLVDDGPAVLAECLVALGGRLARTPALGGLGMAEHRFRSELGRRVERLLALRVQDWRPWRGATAWLARTLGPVALLALALAAAAWLLPREARAASLGEAFHRSPLGLATTALLTADENDAPTLVLQGRKLQAAGKTNEAEAKWRTALELDPANPAARAYLVKLGRTNFPPPKPVLQSVASAVSNPVTRSNLVGTSKARLRIYEKLDGIRFDEVKYDGLPLMQLSDVLSRASRQRDAEQKGVNIVISAEAQASSAPPIDPATGLPVGDTSAAGFGGIHAAIITIDPAVRGVTLHQLLDIIVKVADRPIKYSVEDWGVLFSARSTNEPVVLRTRWFKVDPNTFMAGLGIQHSGTGTNSGGESKRGDYLTAKTDHLLGEEGKKPRSGVSMMEPNPQTADTLITSVRNYFLSAGVDLQPPKSVVFNNRLGMLMVRATLPDLDLIEQAVQVLNMVPPQVEIEVKFCEVPDDAASALGFDFILGSASARSPAVVTNPPAAVPTGTQRRGTVTNSSLSGITGILTREQYRVVLRALEQREGVEILATQKVLTPSGRQAQLKTVDVRTIVTGLQWTTNSPGKPPDASPVTEPFELGPVIDVVPYVAADGYTIQLTVIPSVKEFVGYDLDSARVFDNWEYVKSPAASSPSQLDVIPQRSRYDASRGAPPVRQPTPLPIFRLRQIVSSAIVWDGQTLVLYTHSAKLTIPDNHPAKKLEKAVIEEIMTRFLNAKKLPPKALLVFVTPRIIDTSGNPVHSDEQIRARTNSVPPQVPPKK